RDILRNVQEALMDPRGHELSVEWQTRFEGESWQGEGTLQILGSDYLMLTLPYQKVLIKKTTVMTWYRKTDQVIIDYFDRDDPSNLFSILLGDFSHFSVHESKALSDSITILRLKAKWLVGFEELELTVNEVTWMPEAITAEAGDGWTVTIQVLEDLPLKYPENLVNATLEGSGMIDLTE
ncbi:MAG: hypothetical protein ACE5GH_02545, partial [Fidelibacterota bacterium]